MKFIIVITAICAGFWTGVCSSCETREWSKACSAINKVDLSEIGERYRLAIFGEWHGTNEVPNVLFDIICNIVNRHANQQIIFALEYPITENGDLQKFINSKGMEKDINRFLATLFWRREQQDGRSSMAMFRLLEKLRELRSQMPKLEIIPYVPEIDIKKSTIDESYAVEIEKILYQHPKAIVVVLTGNYHAIRAPSYQTMASLIKSSAFKSYSFSSLGGTAWVCYSPDQCGETAIKGSDRSSPSVPLSKENEKLYDALIDIGNITASPPFHSASN